MKRAGHTHAVICAVPRAQIWALWLHNRCQLGVPNTQQGGYIQSGYLIHVFLEAEMYAQSHLLNSQHQPQQTFPWLSQGS